MLKYYFKIRKFTKQLQIDNMGAYAASMSFFFILSVLPMLMIASGILTYIHWDEATVTKLLNQYIPMFLDGPFNSMIKKANEQYQSILPIAIVALIWSGGKAVWGMMMGLNTVNKVTENRNFVFVRLRASFYSVLMLILLLVCIGLIALSENVVDKINGYLPKLSYWFTFLGNLRFVLIWLLLTLYLTLAYTFLPNVKIKFRKQLPGAFIAAVGCSIYSWGISLYVEYFNSYNLYGSLSTVLLILIWLYICMYMMLIGASVNYYFINGGSYDG